MTSSAGGEDDGNNSNGALFTVGGLDDSNANPDPNAPPANPRTDDELYNLLPFVNTGDTKIAIFTKNPSSDDNIFFSALFLSSTTAVVGEGIVLSPDMATNPVGTQHTVTATLQDTEGHAIVGRSVTFNIVSGPHSPRTSTGVSGSDGKASYTYTGTAAGIDTIQASFVTNTLQTKTSNQVTKTWTAPVLQPDLVITETGEFITPTITYKIKNQGTGAAGASHTFLTIDGIKVAESAVPALAAGEEISLSFDYVYHCTPIGDIIVFLADGDNEVAETNEGNNTLTATPECPALPDLIITDYWVYGYTVFYVIKNQGEGYADASGTYLIIEGDLAIEDSVPALAAGEEMARNFAFSYYCSPPGDALEIVADGSDEIFESDEYNNTTGLIPETCSGQPDLVPTCIIDYTYI
jgi:hypothetical protein